MYHFTHLNIVQFRGLRNLHLENLGSVNLLVGMNNSGKTSVLEAVSLCCRSLDAIEWINTATRRGIRPSFTPSVIEALKWLFPQLQPNHNGDIIITTQGNFAVREVRATFGELISANEILKSETETDLDQDNEDPGQLGALITVRQLHSPANGNELLSTEKKFVLWGNKRITRFRQTLIEQTLPVSTIMPFSYQVGTTQLMQLSDAKKQGTFKPILTLLQQFDPKIEGLELLLSGIGNIPALYLQHADLGLSPIHVFGQGLQRVLAMALSLAQVHNGVLLIDEIEAGIHISWLSTVFNWLVTACRQNHIQLFATTHSLEAVDAMLDTVSTHSIDSDAIVGYRLPAPLTESSLQRFGGNLLHRLRFERGLDLRG